jgi:hypothetical protein
MMKTALILAILLAAVGPLCLPFALAKGRHGAAYAFCLTNLITLLPMIGISTWARYHPPPTCRQLYPNAPCDGIPYEAGWFFINILFVALALWSLLASACLTSGAFQKR